MGLPMPFGNCPQCLTTRIAGRMVCIHLNSICFQTLGYFPSICPLNQWDDLWLTQKPRIDCLSLPPRAPTRRPASRTTGDRREETQGVPAMNAQELLQEISDYCR